MNQTHIHLLVTHLPIVGSILGGLVLAHGLWTKSHQTIIAAYNVLILSSIGAVTAYATGESAAETVEHITGVIETNIEQHEEFALFALISLIALGLASILGLFITLTKSTHIRTTAMVVLFISIISFALVARTGYLGGKIRHSELGANYPSAKQDLEKPDDD